MTPAELERFIEQLAKEAGLPVAETRARFCNTFAPDAVLEAAIERIEMRRQARADAVRHVSAGIVSKRHRWLRHGRAIAGDALAEVLDRIARAFLPAARALERFAIAADDFARRVGGVAVDGAPGLIGEMSTLDDLAFAFVDAPRSLPMMEPWSEPDAVCRLEIPAISPETQERFAEEAAEAVRRCGMAINAHQVRQAERAAEAAQRMAEFNALQAVDRLAYDTPLTPEQARSLIQEHGLEFAERARELVSRGFDYSRAMDSLLGRLGPSWEQHAMNTLTINPSGPLRGVVGVHFDTDSGVWHGPWFKRAPRHGTPSSFVEVCGDAAVGRVRTACDRCGFYSPPSLGKSLTCALHPLGRPEGRCGDWEDRRTEAAAMARGRAELRAREAYGEAIVRRREAIDAAAQRPECHHYINAAGQAVPELITDGGANPPENMVSDRVLTHESVEVVTEAAYGADGMPTGRLITSRTRYRHYADGRREIVPEEPVPPPRLSQPWERPGYRWVSIDGDRVEVSLIRDWPIWVLGIDPAPPEELRNGRVFGVRVVNNGGYSYSKEIPLVSWCSERDRFECSTPAGWRHCFRLSS